MVDTTAICAQSLNIYVVLAGSIAAFHLKSKLWVLSQSFGSSNSIGNGVFYALESLSHFVGMQACALLFDSVNKEDPTIRIGVIMGLGLAYPDTRKEEVRFISIFLVRWGKSLKILCCVSVEATNEGSLSLPCMEYPSPLIVTGVHYLCGRH